MDLTPAALFRIIARYALVMMATQEILSLAAIGSKVSSKVSLKKIRDCVKCMVVIIPA